MTNDASSPIALTDDQALYLYSLVRTATEPACPEGMSGEPVRPLVLDEALVAIVEIVDRAAWTGPDAQRNMETLRWVGPRAVMHEHVVEAVMDEGPVYPARFGTLFSSVDRLEEIVAAHRDELDAFLNRVETRGEWAIKAFLDRDRAADHLAARADDQEDSEEPSGAAYLKRRLKEQKARESVDDWVAGTAESLQDTVRRLAADMRVLDMQQSLHAAADQSMVFNWAVLVEGPAAATLREQVQAANERFEAVGLTLQLTGPWPPYSFRPKLEGLAPATSRPSDR